MTDPEFDKLDPVWKALSDPTRRQILDMLRSGPRNTSEIVDAFPELSRFGVMKHLDVLKQAHLVIAHKEGRVVHNRLNPVPLRQIYERWMSPFEDLWASKLLRIKDTAEKKPPSSDKTR